MRDLAIKTAELVLPVLLALLPLHLLALGRPSAILHFTYGLLSALVLGEIFLLGYRRLPFASSYVRRQSSRLTVVFTHLSS